MDIPIKQKQCYQKPENKSSRYNKKRRGGLKRRSSSGKHVQLNLQKNMPESPEKKFSSREDLVLVGFEIILLEKSDLGGSSGEMHPDKVQVSNGDWIQTEWGILE